jgi:hypothetical protein
MSSLYPPAEPAIAPAELDDGDDEMSPEGLRELLAELSAAEADIAAGVPRIPAEEVLAWLGREDDVD